MAQGISFKVYLKHGNNKEIKRFTIEDPSVATNYEYFREKLLTVFPIARGYDFKITYSDSDGDDITVSSDDDLLVAYTQIVEDVKVFNLIIKEQGENPGLFASANMVAVTCDVCQDVINHYRYKCLECPDYDLCEKCEHSGHHPQHMMLRVTNLSLPRSLGKIMHCVSRCARKGGLNAAREAHRFAKCNKHDEPKHPKDKQHHKGEKNCPFKSGPNLYNLAESFLTSLLPPGPSGGTTSSPQPNATGATNNNNANNQQRTNVNSNSSNPVPDADIMVPEYIQQAGELTENIIKNILGAFSASAATQANAAGSGQSAVNASAPSSSTSMDIEYESVNSEPTKAQNQANKGEDQSTLNSGNIPKPAEPGWTILSNPHEMPVQESVNPAPPTATAENVTGKFAQQLLQLRKMGFTDEIDLNQLLEQFDGNVGYVVNYIFQKKDKF